VADQIKVDIVAAYKDKAAKDALKDAEEIEQADPELTITAEDKASPDLKEVTTLAETLDKADATIVLQAKVDVAQADLKAAKTALEDLDGKTATVKVDTTEAQQNIGEIGRSSEAATSVLANSVGNASADLGELGGVAGTAGQAIGQIGEYATEALASGEKFGTVLANFGKVAGPIAAITLGIQGVVSVVGAFKKQAEQVAKIKAFNEENVQTFVDLAIQGRDIIRELIDLGRTEGKIEVAPDADQQTAALERMRLEGEDLYDVIQRIGPAFDMRKANEEAVNITTLLDAAKLKAEDFYKAAADPASLDAFIAKVKESGISLADQATLISGVIYQEEQFVLGTDEAAERARVFGIDASNAGKDVSELGDDAKDAGGKVRDFSADTLEAKDAAREAADAVAAFDAKIRLLLGEIDEEQAWLTLRGNLDELRTHLYEVGSASDAGRLDILAIREELLLYLADMEGVPEYKQTEIVALINQDEFDKAELELAKLAKSRFVEYTPVMTRGNIPGLPPGVGVGASSVTPPPVAPVPTAGAFTVNVNMPRGSRGVDVVRQIAGQARRSGRRYGVPVVHYARGRQFPGGGPK